MNSILTKKFPKSIVIDGINYGINADFRNCLIIILAFEDDELSLEDKYEILLLRLYKKVPKNIEQAIENGIYFLDCNNYVNLKNNDEVKKRLYSFSNDGARIYSAINQTNHIDLEAIEFLHWWKFVFLFMDINKDCIFSQLLSFRKKIQDGKLTPDEKKTYLEMRELIDLDYNSDEEENSEFMNLWNGGDNKE